MKAIGRRVALAVLTATVASSSACNPCGGVSDCATDSRLSMTGQFVEHVGGRQVAGVRVDVSPSTGAPAFAPLSATTDAHGFWHADGPAPDGDLTVDVLVTPPSPHAPYRVQGLRVRSTTRRGDGVIAGRWVVDPYVQFLGEVQARNDGRKVTAATVTFRRVGGVAVTPSVVTTVTNDVGRFLLELTANGVGDVVADIVVSAVGLTRATSFANSRIHVQYRDEPAEVAGVFSVGIWLTYTGEIYFRGTGAPLANTDVTFRRTGGIATVPLQFTTRTDANGRFLIAPAPESEGEVVGELSFTPPGGTAPIVLPNIRLATYDSTETRLVRVGYGQQLRYAGELEQRGTFARAVGVPIEFRRTGGIAIAPSVLRATSDQNGRFPIAAQTTDSGEVVGDLVIDPDGPRREVYSGIRLRTFASDESRFAKVWSVGDGIFYSIELFKRSTGERAAGIDAQFVRTGGVEIAPSTTTGRSDAAGRALVAAAASAPGVVVGDLVLRRPDGFVTTVRGVRLATQRDDSLRLAGVWGFGPSLLYAGEVLDKSNDRPIAGARITFERTGGIAAVPERTTATSDALGRFPLHLASDAAGDVIGTLTIVPPAPWTGSPIVIPNVVVPTFDGDEQRLLAVWRIPPPGG